MAIIKKCCIALAMLLSTSTVAAMLNHGQLNKKTTWPDDICTLIDQAKNTSPQAVNALFIAAARDGQVDIVATLLRPTEHPTAMTKDGIPNYCDPIPTLQKAFVEAVKNGHLNVVEELFKSSYFKQSCFDNAPWLARYGRFLASKPGQEEMYKLIKKNWPIHSAL